MIDRATPNLPAQDLRATLRFYARLGFHETYRDDGWLVLERGSIQLEFFPWPQLDPETNIGSCCIRVAEVDALDAAWQDAGIPISPLAIPRISAPVDQPRGMREFAVVDPDGNLLRCLSPIAPK